MSAGGLGLGDQCRAGLLVPRLWIAAGCQHREEKGNDGKRSNIAVHGRVPESGWNKCAGEYSINSELTSPVLASYVYRENIRYRSRPSHVPRQTRSAAAASAPPM